MTELTLTADREGERADALLSRLAPGLTRSAAQKLLERGAEIGRASCRERVSAVV